MTCEVQDDLLLLRLAMRFSHLALLRLEGKQGAGLSCFKYFKFLN